MLYGGRLEAVQWRNGGSMVGNEDVILLKIMLFSEWRSALGDV